MSTVIMGLTYRAQQAGWGNDSPHIPMLNSLGEQVVMDWLQKAVLDGSVYQVRAGTITTPLTGDVDITDTAAEMSADAATGTTIIPVRFNYDIESLGGTLPNVALKSVAAVSTAGTAFAPLPMRSDGGAAVSTARVQAAGAVTVAAELATTTLRHFSGTASAITDTDAGGVVNLLPAPVLVGPRCFYVQVGTVTTGSVYFASFEYVEYASDLVER